MAAAPRSRVLARAPHALAGVLATVTGMAAGHLVASALTPSASPVLAVGSLVIDNTPTPVKTWAIDTFGNADKPLLLGSVVAVTLLIAGAAGVLARRRRVVGTGLLLTLVAAAGVAALLRPAAGPLDVLPALATAVAGVGVFLLLLRRLREEDRPAVTGAGGERGHTRRGFLVVAGVTTAAAAVMTGAGQLVSRARTAVGAIALPAPADAAPALPTGLEEEHPGISALRTPTEEFYRVDVNLSVPIVDQDAWTLKVDGDVEQPYELTFEELLAMPMVERDITMTCVSNNVGGPYVGAARWLGVPMVDLLERARPRRGNDMLLSTAVDGFTISTPLAVATDGRDCLVVVAMNGEPLPREHGFPVRMITPGIYGYVGATKWLERLTVTRYDAETAYWTERGWATDAPIKISSRIDTPSSLSRVPAGRTVVGGVAWAQTRGIASVELQVDGGPWTACELGPDVGLDYWRQWYAVIDLGEGQHRLTVRATDRDGAVQTPVKAPDFPDGSSGLHQVLIIAEPRENSSE